MLNDFTGADRVYIACGYTDLRKGIDGLTAMVQQEFELDPLTNTLFLFCGRRRDRIKGLYWEQDGFILLYKRLERGVYQWPRSEREVKQLQYPPQIAIPAMYLTVCLCPSTMRFSRLKTAIFVSRTVNTFFKKGEPYENDKTYVMRVILRMPHDVIENNRAKRFARRFLICGFYFIYTVKKILQCFCTFLNLDQLVYMMLLSLLLNIRIIENVKDWIHLYLPLSVIQNRSFKYGPVKQEIINADRQYPVFIIPRVRRVTRDADFTERIIDFSERPDLLLAFFLIGDGVRRLDIDSV